MAPCFMNMHHVFIQILPKETFSVGFQHIVLPLIYLALFPLHSEKRNYSVFIYADKRKCVTELLLLFIIPYCWQEKVVCVNKISCEQLNRFNWYVTHLSNIIQQENVFISVSFLTELSFSVAVEEKIKMS